MNASDYIWIMRIELHIFTCLCLVTSCFLGRSSGVSFRSGQSSVDISCKELPYDGLRRHHRGHLRRRTILRPCHQTRCPTGEEPIGGQCLLGQGRTRAIQAPYFLVLFRWFSFLFCWPIDLCNRSIAGDCRSESVISYEIDRLYAFPVICFIGVKARHCGFEPESVDRIAKNGFS